MTDKELDAIWEKITDMVEQANERLEEHDVQMHIEKYQYSDLYQIYELYDGGDQINIIEDDIKLEDAPALLEKLRDRLFEEYEIN